MSPADLLYGVATGKEAPPVIPLHDGYLQNPNAREMLENDVTRVPRRSVQLSIEESFSRSVRARLG